MAQIKTVSGFNEEPVDFIVTKSIMCYSGELGLSGLTPFLRLIAVKRKNVTDETENLRDSFLD